MGTVPSHEVVGRKPLLELGHRYLGGEGATQCFPLLWENDQSTFNTNKRTNPSQSGGQGGQKNIPPPPHLILFHDAKLMTQPQVKTYQHGGDSAKYEDSGAPCQDRATQSDNTFLQQKQEAEPCPNLKPLPYVHSYMYTQQAIPSTEYISYPWEYHQWLPPTTTGKFQYGNIPGSLLLQNNPLNSPDSSFLPPNRPSSAVALNASNNSGIYLSDNWRSGYRSQYDHEIKPLHDFQDRESTSMIWNKPPCSWKSYPHYLSLACPNSLPETSTRSFHPRAKPRQLPSAISHSNQLCGTQLHSEGDELDVHGGTNSGDEEPSMVVTLPPGYQIQRVHNQKPVKSLAFEANMTVESVSENSKDEATLVRLKVVEFDQLPESGRQGNSQKRRINTEAYHSHNHSENDGRGLNIKDTQSAIDRYEKEKCQDFEGITDYYGRGNVEEYYWNCFHNADNGRGVSEQNCSLDYYGNTQTSKIFNPTIFTVPSTRTRPYIRRSECHSAGSDQNTCDIKSFGSESGAVHILATITDEHLKEFIAQFGDTLPMWKPTNSQGVQVYPKKKHRQSHTVANAEKYRSRISEPGPRICIPGRNSTSKILRSMTKSIVEDVSGAPTIASRSSLPFHSQ